MKATDRQLIDISEELTAYIMKPTFNLCLSPDECIILNKLITEEFERRQEQDVMGSSDRQDPSLGQTGDNHNDDALDASEHRDNEASGTPLREKKRPQITKVSKKEYWDNRDKHGAISIDIYKLFGHSFDDKLLNFGGMPLLDKYIPIAWMEERIRANRFPFPTSFTGYDAVYQSVIDSWETFGRDDWYKDVHDEC